MGTTWGELVYAEGDTAAAQRAAEQAESLAAVNGHDPATVERLEAARTAALGRAYTRAEHEADLADAYEAQPGGTADLDRHAANWAEAHAASHPAPGPDYTAPWPDAQPAAEPADRYAEHQVVPADRAPETAPELEAEPG